MTSIYSMSVLRADTYMSRFSCFRFESVDVLIKDFAQSVARSAQLLNGVNNAICNCATISEIILCFFSKYIFCIFGVSII